MEEMLSNEDARYLRDLEQKLQVVRDRTTAVVKFYATGFYLFGEGGVGKSYTVLEELQKQEADVIVYNSRMTGRGLFNALEQAPASIHLLEDMEAISGDRGAQGVLRSALWAQRPPGAKGKLERLVTWTTFKMEHSFIFTGGIIMIANRPLSNVPELHAIKTRIPCLQLLATAHEMRALMRNVATKGFKLAGKEMDPSECREVCEYLIGESMTMRRSLDMRLLVNSFADYLQWQDSDAGCHWKDLVAVRIRERTTEFREDVTVGIRTAQKREELKLLETIIKEAQDRKEQLIRWQAKTGKSQSAFYRRLAELENGSHSRN